MERYRQQIRIYDSHVTMVGMVSDLTGLIRGYYQNWRRPLSERREDLQTAKKLGRTIVGIASQRPWREDALQDVLRALHIQDSKMHDLTNDILTDARAERQIASYQGLYSEFQFALHEGTSEDIWQTSKDLYRLSQQILIYERDVSYKTAFSRQLEALRRKDPLMYRRITTTLNEVASLQSETVKQEVPHPRFESREVIVYRSS